MEKWYVIKTWKIKDGWYVKGSYKVFIGEDARIGEDASIGASARIDAGTSIGVGARIGASARIIISPPYFGKHSNTFPIGYSEPGMIFSGCIVKPLSWWKKNIRRCANEHRYSLADVDEYEWRVKVIGEWMERHGVSKE